MPKPSKNNSYCCICKAPFEDYLSVPPTLFSTSICPPIRPRWRTQSTTTKYLIYATCMSPGQLSALPRRGVALPRQRRLGSWCFWRGWARRQTRRATRGKRWLFKLWLDLLFQIITPPLTFSSSPPPSPPISPTPASLSSIDPPLPTPPPPSSILIRSLP